LDVVPRNLVDSYYVSKEPAESIMRGQAKHEENNKNTVRGRIGDLTNPIGVRPE
jgi:hypothetical protein